MGIGQFVVDSMVPGRLQSKNAEKEDEQIHKYEANQEAYMNKIMRIIESGRTKAEKEATERGQKIYGDVDTQYADALTGRQTELEAAKEKGLGAEQYAEVRKKYDPQEKRLRASIAKSGVRGPASVAMREDIEASRDREMAIMSKQVKDQATAELFKFMATKKLSADSDRSARIAEEMGWSQLQASPYFAKMQQVPYDALKPEKTLMGSMLGGII